MSETVIDTNHSSREQGLPDGIDVEVAALQQSLDGFYAPSSLVDLQPFADRVRALPRDSDGNVVNGNGEVYDADVIDDISYHASPEAYTLDTAKDRGVALHITHIDDESKLREGGRAAFDEYTKSAEEAGREASFEDFQAYNKARLLFTKDVERERRHQNSTHATDTANTSTQRKVEVANDDADSKEIGELADDILSRIGTSTETPDNKAKQQTSTTTEATPPTGASQNQAGGTTADKPGRRNRDNDDNRGGHEKKLTRQEQLEQKAKELEEALGLWLKYNGIRREQWDQWPADAQKHAMQKLDDPEIGKKEHDRVVAIYNDQAYIDAWNAKPEPRPKVKPKENQYFTKLEGWRWNTSRDAEWADMKANDALRYNKVGDVWSGQMNAHDYHQRLHNEIREFEGRHGLELTKSIHDIPMQSFAEMRASALRRSKAVGKAALRGTVATPGFIVGGAYHTGKAAKDSILSALDSVDGAITSRNTRSYSRSRSTHRLVGPKQATRQEKRAESRADAALARFEANKAAYEAAEAQRIARANKTAYDIGIDDDKTSVTEPARRVLKKPTLPQALTASGRARRRYERRVKKLR